MFKAGDRIKDTTTDKGTYTVTDVQDRCYLLSRGTWDWMCSKKYVDEYFKLAKEAPMETIKIKDWKELDGTSNDKYRMTRIGSYLDVYAKEATSWSVAIDDSVSNNERVEVLKAFGFFIEFVEPIKLTEQEYHFVRAFKEGWLCRNPNGAVSLYFKNPPRSTLHWSGWAKAILPDDMFKFITWESEPWSIEELQKLEMKGERQ